MGNKNGGQNKQIMDSRKKIALFALLSILISVSLLVILESQYPLKKTKALEDILNEKFFLKDFTKTKNVVLLGTSHVAQANTTVINQKVTSQLSGDYAVYNLGIGGDNPSKRIHQVDQIISMKPVVVFYGISYYDYPATQEKDVLLTKITKLISLFVNNGTSFDNPQLFTRNYLFPSKAERKISPLYDDDCFSIANTPFDKYCPKNKYPKSLDELKKAPMPTWTNDLTKERMADTAEIIKKFENKGIKVVFFATPVNQIYIDHLSTYQKNSFDQILKNLQSKFGVKVYDFRYKYDNLPVWSDTSHIIETNGTVYDDDLAKMIIQEIK